MSCSSFSVNIPWERELAAAARMGYVAAIDSILSCSDVVDLGRSVWPFESSPLHEAVFWEAPLAVFDQLVGAGIDVDCLHGDCDKTAIFTAVSSRNREIVRKLLELGANPDLKSNVNTCHPATPLEFAKLRKFDEIVKTLEEHAAKRKTRDAIKLLTAKVESKRKLEDEFARAAEILTTLDRDDKNLRDLDRKARDLEREMKGVQEERRRLQTSILARRCDPDFPTPSKMKRMRMDLEESCEVYRALEKVVGDAGPARSGVTGANWFSGEKNDVVICKKENQ